MGMEPITGTQIFRDEQKILKGLFRQAEVVDRRAHEMRQGVINELFMMLEVQLDLEEEFLFSLLHQSKNERSRELATQMFARDEELRTLIHQLQKRPVHDENFKTGLTVLITTAEEYLRLESDQLFPAVDSEFGSKLKAMEPQVQERRSQHMNAPRYEGARPDEVQNPNGGEQMRKEQIKKSVA